MPSAWRSARQKQIEDAFLDEGIEKDRRSVQRQQQARGNADSPRKDFFAGKKDQHAGKRAEYDLDETDRPEIVPEDGLQDGKKIWIERRLVKYSISQPRARDDALCPFIVGPCVPRQVDKKRNGIDLKQIDQPEGEGENEDPRAAAPAKAIASLRPFRLSRLSGTRSALPTTPRTRVPHSASGCILRSRTASCKWVAASSRVPGRPVLTLNTL